MRDLHFSCHVIGVICAWLFVVAALVIFLSCHQMFLDKHIHSVMLKSNIAQVHVSFASLLQQASLGSGRSQGCAMRFRRGMKTSLYLIVRARETHGIPPPSIHTALLHLTAKIFDGVAFEQAGTFHLLGVWSVLMAYGGGARDELVIFVSKILGRLLGPIDQDMIPGLFD